MKFMTCMTCGKGSGTLKKENGGYVHVSCTVATEQRKALADKLRKFRKS